MLVSIDKTPSPKKVFRGYGFSYLVVIIIFLPNRSYSNSRKRYIDLRLNTKCYMVRSSKKAVYAALFGNLGIAIAKLIAAILTGEHSNVRRNATTLFRIHLTKSLLLFGIKTSTKAPTEQHPFGYGKEQFFWSFVVATMLFGISGILSLQRGFGSLLSSDASYPER